MAKQFSKDDLDALKKQLLEMGQAQASMTDNLKSYAEVLLQVKENYRDIENVQNQVKKSETIIRDKAKEINKLIKQGKTSRDKEVATLLKEVELENDVLTINKENLKVLNQQNNSLKKNLNLYNASSAAVGSIKGGLKYVGKQLFEQINFTSKIKSNFFEQSKAIKNTELSMGILSTQSKAFSNSIFKASVNSNQLGVSAADLAGIQGDYSESIGRAVQLTESGYQAMAELAQGTILGNDGAAALAANMDKFNISANGSRDLVEETLNIAHKMGVNAAKTTKNIEHSLKLAQKYNFKGGVKGAMQMAAFVAKTGFEMQEMAGLADKLFSPEGAVEMSAQLQVLGGEWAKLADPFTLMYKARNDMAGLTEDLVKATTASAHFNAKTGELDISALEMHRLKEVADATGLSYENLANTARTTGKLLKIKASITGINDPDVKEFITNTAQFNEKSGKFEIKIGSESLAVDELSKYSKGNVTAALKQEMNQKEDLKQRAIQAQTLQDTWQNIQNTFQSLFLPLFDGIQRGLGEPMQELFKYMQDNGFTEKMVKFGESIGSLVGGLAKFAIENPITSALTAIAGYGLFEAAKWYLNGKVLRMGFDSQEDAANLFGLGGKSSGLGGGGLMNDYKSNRAEGGGVLGSLASSSKKNKWGMGSKGIAGIAGGLLSSGLGMASESLGEDSGLGKAMGVGSSALGGASMGMMFGPIGALVGGLLGGAYGLYDEFGSEPENPISGRVNQDFVMRPGQAAAPFSEKDTLVGFKPGGPIDKLSQTSNSASGNMEISFKPLKIEFGALKLELNNNSIDIDLKNNPKFISDITIAIQEQLRMNLNGGKLAPNQAY
jgi:hypothetical protein